jgi:predicted nucleotidyltransferase
LVPIFFALAVFQPERLSSDLDIAIAAEKPLPPNKLLELSEELSPETHCETDLVDLMAATGAILKQALSTGIVV